MCIQQPYTFVSSPPRRQKEEAPVRRLPNRKQERIAFDASSSLVFFSIALAPLVDLAVLLSQTITTLNVRFRRFSEGAKVLQEGTS